MQVLRSFSKGGRLNYPTQAKSSETLCEGGSKITLLLALLKAPFLWNFNCHPERSEGSTKRDSSPAQRGQNDRRRSNLDKHIKSAKEIKRETVVTLTEKVSRAKTIAFAKYHGLTVNQISALREKVHEAGGEILVSKNSLMKRAVLKNNMEDPGAELTGPIATIFAYEDEIAPIKAAADNAKTSGLPSFVFGFFGTKRLDAAGLDALAKIPGRDVLQGKVVGTLAAPIIGIVNVLQANIRNLAVVIGEIGKQKS